MDEIERIFNRQAVRCKAELRDINCPEPYIASFNKFFDFAKQDIKSEWRMENGMDEGSNR